MLGLVSLAKVLGGALLRECTLRTGLDALVGWVQRSGTQSSPRILGLLGSAIAPTNLREIKAFRRYVRQVGL